MRVVDASVIVSALLDSASDGCWAEAEIARGSLAGPELVLARASNILRRLELAGDMSRPEVASAHRDLLRLDIDLCPFAPFAERAWALRDNLTCYDAWYVALAETLACPLVTLDRKLSRAPGPRCRFATPPQRV